jgi:diadenosine tetraphosphate (Ap4A) HIT family hydrolase
MECPFCTLPDDRIVAEDALTITIGDGYPVSPGHSLVLPKRHIRSLFETTDSERDALWRAIRRARVRLEAELHPDGWNIGVNEGDAGGQTIKHLHLHLIPRFQGDTPDPRGGVRHCIPGKGYYDDTGHHQRR